jgi:hypothetical protein
VTVIYDFRHVRRSTEAERPAERPLPANESRDEEQRTERDGRKEGNDVFAAAGERVRSGSGVGDERASAVIRRDGRGA